MDLSEFRSSRVWLIDIGKSHRLDDPIFESIRQEPWRTKSYLVSQPFEKLPASQIE